MNKKPIAIISATVIAAVAAFGSAACSAKPKEELTVYGIEAALSSDYTLTASVTCDYVNNTEVPQDELWFHLYPNAFREGAKFSPVPSDRITAAYPDGRSYSTLDITSVSVNGTDVDISVTGSDENILAVDLGGKLEPLDRTVVKIDYSVKIPKVRHRFGYNDNSVNLANFYPIACVYRDGAFVADPYYSTGDPFFSEVADYNVKLTAPKELTGAFTGSVKSTETNEETVTYSVEAKSVRDFAAVLGKYEKMSGRAGDVVVNYYYHRDSQPERALNTAILAVKTFGGLFGTYAYPEYNVVQTAFLQGGMEYPALSMISDAYSGDAYDDVIVHETAHQWWYSAVGNDQVKYPWLDEGLAEYTTMMFYENNANAGYKYTFNGKRADALSAYTLFCETFKSSGDDDTSMTRASYEYGSELEYSYMSYVKGALMLDDVRNSIGSEAFLNGLKKYYSDNMHGVAEPQDLIGAMEKSSRRELAALFDCWLDGNVKLYA